MLVVAAVIFAVAVVMAAGVVVAVVVEAKRRKVAGKSLVERDARIATTTAVQRIFFREATIIL